MNLEKISEIAIDDSGRLIVKPTKQEFDYIYRSALEIHWDSKKKCLYSPKPREWTYLDWYKQIMAAVESEYGYELILTAETKWTNAPATLKDKIENWIAQKQNP